MAGRPTEKSEGKRGEERKKVFVGEVGRKKDLAGHVKDPHFF